MSRGPRGRQHAWQEASAVQGARNPKARYYLCTCGAVREDVPGPLGGRQHFFRLPGKTHWQERSPACGRPIEATGRERAAAGGAHVAR